MGISRCPVACGILVPGPGVEPMSPAPAGGFLTTGPPGKSCLTSFDEWLWLGIWAPSKFKLRKTLWDQSRPCVDFWLQLLDSSNFALGFPGGSVGKESTCQCRYCAWVGKILWRRKWQPTPVFLPGESYGQRSLLGDSPWGRKESDTTEQRKTVLH